MLNIVLYFQIHQPYRLKNIRIFDIKNNTDLFNDELNRKILERVARKCYLPTGTLLARLIDEYGDTFKITFSISGTTVEQLKIYCPHIAQLFRELVQTGSIALLGETYYHSLFSLYDRDEFIDQVGMHLRLMQDEFGVVPTVFRNTELIYDDRVSDYIGQYGNFKVILTEGSSQILGEASSLRPYRSYNNLHSILLRNFLLSDDIAFRFSDREWSEYPLTAEKLAAWIEQLYRDEETDRPLFLNLFIDYETFGEHQWEGTGIFQFLRDLPECILKHKHLRFGWPSDLTNYSHGSVKRVSIRSPISWADSERNISAWLSNPMQLSAIETLVELVREAKVRGDGELLNLVRKLSSSDHFYYMYMSSSGPDNSVHRYFSPFNSPDSAYIQYLHALASVEEKIHS